MAATAALSRVVFRSVEQNRNFFSMLRAITRSTSITQYVSATNAKNEFVSVLDAAIQDEAMVAPEHKIRERFTSSLKNRGKWAARLTELRVFDNGSEDGESPNAEGHRAR